MCACIKVSSEKIIWPYGELSTFSEIVKKTVLPPVLSTLRCLHVLDHYLSCVLFYSPLVHCLLKYLLISKVGIRLVFISSFLPAENRSAAVKVEIIRTIGAHMGSGYNLRQNPNGCVHGRWLE